MTLSELASYQANATEFDRMGLSHILDSDGTVTEKIATTFSGTVLTFVPTSTFGAGAAVAELWQQDLSTSVVNDYINQAIDLVQEEALQRWSAQHMAYQAGRLLYLLSDNTAYNPYPKYITEVWYHPTGPATGWAFSEATSFLRLGTPASQTYLAQGFKVPTSGFYEGAVLYLRFLGTGNPLLLADVYTATGSVPNAIQTAGLGIYPHNGTPTDGIRSVYFKWREPVYLTSGTQYFLVLTSTSISGTDVRWALDTNTANLYADGATATGDAIPAWTAQTGQCFCFHIIPYSEDWVRLQDSEWDIEIGGPRTDASSIRGTSSIRLLFEAGRALPTLMGGTREIADGTPLRVVGLRSAGRPALDTSVMDVPRAYVESKALSILLRNLDPALLPQAQFLEQVADRELHQHPVRTALPPGARKLYYAVS